MNKTNCRAMKKHYLPTQNYFPKKQYKTYKIQKHETIQAEVNKLDKQYSSHIWVAKASKK